MGRAVQRNVEVHIIPGTHWDREWRFGFEETRQRLIQTLDRTIAALEKDPRIRSFTLDGQVMPVEDYLELRPHNRSRVEKLIRDKRLVIGPWYSLPDMPPLIGESIVRNLFRGIVTARQLGECLQEGFTSSSWGQISQMPQICRGFGMDVYFSYHGVPGHKLPVEFWWEGPDGSRVLFIRPIRGTKSAFFLCEARSRAVDPDLWEHAEWGSPALGEACRLTDRPLTDATPFHADDTHRPVDYDVLCASYRDAREVGASEVATPHVMLGELQDQQNMPPEIAGMVEEIVRRDRTGDRIAFSSLEHYFRKVKQDARGLKTFKGEMRYPAKEAFTFRLMSVLSSRIYLKLLNREAEYLLTKWAEPFCTLAHLQGADYPENDLWYAWRMMHINHGHDNIGGCSVDVVHDDMLYRHRQIVELGRTILRQGLVHLTRKIGATQLGPGESRLVVFNPLSRPRSDVVEVVLDLPPAMASEGLVVTDTEGQPAPCHVVSVSRPKPVTVEMPLANLLFMDTRRVKVAIETRNVPAMGYAEYRVAAGKSAPPAEKSTLRCDRNRMENDHLKVTVKADGTVDVVDKSTGQVFRGLHYFQDNGQERTANISWNLRTPRHDKVFSTRRGKARIVEVSRSALAVQLKVTYAFRIPRSLDLKKSGDADDGVPEFRWGRMMHTADRRSPTLISLPIESVFTLRKGARRIDVETTVTNRALDHRLRVMFPTGVETDASWADSPYDVVRRGIERLDSDDWIETKTFGPLPTQPMLRFVDVASSVRSLAVIGEGLPEYELLDDSRRTIALTLLRAIVNGRADPDTPVPPVYGSQCQGTYTFRYAIFPHKGKWDRAGIMEQALRHNLPLKAVQALGPGSGELPVRKGFIEFDKPGLMVTAVKKAHESRDVIVRIVNPTTRTVKTGMTCGFAIQAAKLVDLLERPSQRSALKVHDRRTIDLKVGPKKILTLRLHTPRKRRRQ